MDTGERADVVVVGGGLSGLAVAAYLAKAGQKVRVFEKAEAPGGRARTRTQDGFHFNLGPHALYRVGRGGDVLRELGVACRGGMPSAAGAFALHGEVLHTLPVGFVSLLTTGLLSPREKIEAGRHLARLGRHDTRPLQSVNLAGWLDDHVDSEKVRGLLATIVRLATYTDDPDRLSAGAALDQIRGAGKGVLYLDGGWQTLVDGLHAVAEAAGARIVTHRGVAAVVRDASVRGVRLEGGTFVPADCVVIAGSPRMAAELTHEGAPTAMGEWAARAVPVFATCLDVALDRLPRPAARFALGIDRPLYASVHSSVARLAPEGGALLQLARYGGLRGDKPADVERELENLLDALQPGWRGHLVHRRFLPEMVVSNAVVTADSGALAGRPGPAVPDVPGLYVAGDWVGPEGMLADASLASARQAAEAILVRRPARSQAA